MPTDDDMLQAGTMIRTATSEDATAFFSLFAQIQQLHRDAMPNFFRRPVKDADFESYFDWLVNEPSQNLMFCCHDGVVVGYIQYFLGMCPRTVYQRERRLAHIEQLFMAPHYRRAGFATDLILYSMEDAKRSGARQIGLEVWLFNDAARDCFEKAGFQMKQASMWQSINE